jgi:hypothetical protein
VSLKRIFEKRTCEAQTMSNSSTKISVNMSRLSIEASREEKDLHTQQNLLIMDKERKKKEEINKNNNSIGANKIKSGNLTLFLF